MELIITLVSDTVLVIKATITAASSLEDISANQVVIYKRESLMNLARKERPLAVAAHNPKNIIILIKVYSFG